MNDTTIQTYTTNLYELIKYTQTVIRTQKNSEQIMNTKAVDLLHNMDLAFSKQINSFEEMGVLNEGTQKSVKDNVAKAAGKITGFIDAARNDAASKMIRDDYTALSLIASGYTMLYTAALGKGNTELSDFAQKSLARTAQLITETSKVLPHIVADEMNISGIAKEAEENTQKAWDPENLPV